MKKESIRFLLLLSILGIPTSIRAQSFTIDSSKKSIDISAGFNGASVHLPAVNKLPEFPGGKNAWRDFLRSGIDTKIPIAHKATPGTYKVMIRFIVRHDGKLLEIGADSNCGYGMESEVIRCIKKSIDWIPAETSSGKKVAFTLRTIVIFTVKHNDVNINFP